LRLFESHLAPRAEHNEGQQLIVWAADDGDEDASVLFEVYRDRAATDASGQADRFSTYVAEATPLLARPPAMMTAVPRWTKGVPR
jgi:quinol monooxygenase YgiN